MHVWRDEVISEADARRFAEADIFVVPTLSVMVSAEDSAVAELGQETDEALLSPMQRQTLADRFPGGFGEGVEVVMENVRWLRAAGVPLVAGTDAPNPGTGAGISMHGELRLLSRAGLGSAEALAAATSVAADAFGVVDRGRIDEGHLADLVLVRGDLEEGVSRSHDIVAIWKDGYLVDRGLGSASAAGAPQTEAAPAPAATDGRGLRGRARGGMRHLGRDDRPDGRRCLQRQHGRAGTARWWSPARSPWGLAFPWAGVIWMPGEQPMQPVDFSGREVDPLPDAGGWAAVLGNADQQRRASGPAPHRDVHRARRVDPSRDPAGGLPDGHAGSHCGAGVCGGGTGWGFGFEVDEVEVR